MALSNLFASEEENHWSPGATIFSLCMEHIAFGELVKLSVKRVEKNGIIPANIDLCNVARAGRHIVCFGAPSMSPRPKTWVGNILWVLAGRLA